MVGDNLPMEPFSQTREAVIIADDNVIEEINIKEPARFH